MKFSDTEKAAKSFDAWVKTQEKEVGKRLRKDAKLVFTWLTETVEGGNALDLMHDEVFGRET